MDVVCMTDVRREMNARAYSWQSPSDATQCFGNDDVDCEGLVDLSTYNCFGARDSVTLLNRFETASRLRNLRRIWLTDTFQVVLGLAKRAQVTPIYYWEQPDPIAMTSHRDEGYEVAEKCWQGCFTVVHLWTPCLYSGRVLFGLTGHLQVGVNAYNFEKLRDILRTRGLLQQFALLDLVTPKDSEIIYQILTESML